MYAILKTGGKQYRVSQGEKVKVEKINGNEGDVVEFKEVLMVEKDGAIIVDPGKLKEVKVTGELLRQERDKKIIVFKSKRKKNYKKKMGHRQHFTEVKINEIVA
ncbi:MAG: 50S ribosomal protein L21 [bacterium]